jgi:hypothetical protein
MSKGHVFNIILDQICLATWAVPVVLIMRSLKIPPRSLFPRIAFRFEIWNRTMRFEHGITSRCTISCHLMLSRLNIAMCMTFEHITPATPVYTITHVHITREITGRNREISTGIERCMKQEEEESRLIPHKYYWGKIKSALSPVTEKCHKTYLC